MRRFDFDWYYHEEVDHPHGRYCRVEEELAELERLRADYDDLVAKFVAVQTELHQLRIKAAHTWQPLPVGTHPLQDRASILIGGDGQSVLVCTGEQRIRVDLPAQLRVCQERAPGGSECDAQPGSQWSDGCRLTGAGGGENAHSVIAKMPTCPDE